MAGIDEALRAIMLGIDAIGKERKNKDQNFNYRSIEDVYNELHPLFAENGVVIITKKIEVIRADTLTTKSGGQAHMRMSLITYALHSTIDGSELEIVGGGEGLDTSDKALQKSASYAQKVALLQLFLIPTKDLVDGDSEGVETVSMSKEEAELRGLIEKGVFNAEWTDYALEMIRVKSIPEIKACIAEGKRIMEGVK